MRWVLTVNNAQRITVAMKQVFDLWPTLGEAAEAFGEPYPTVGGWKRKGMVPAEHDVVIVDRAESIGNIEITYEWLAKERRRIARARKAKSGIQPVRRFEQGAA